MAESLTEIATRHQVFLERLKTSEANKFVTVLDEADKLIRETLSMMDSGKVNNTGKMVLNTMLKDLRKKQQVLYRRNEKLFLKSLKEITGYEAEFESRAIERSIAEELGRTAPAVKIPTAEQAFAAATTKPLSATGQMLRPFIKNWSSSQINKVEQSIRRGWAEGRTVGQMSREIRGTKALKYKDGIIRGLANRQAQAVVRTSIQHVSSAGRMATWERNQDIVKEYRWVATLDSRTTHQCQSLDGRTFKVNDGPRPPIHVQCRSTTVAVPAKKYSFLQDGQTRASKDGYVRGKQTYYQWLKKQPKYFQVEALGAKRTKLFREGGLSAKRFSELQLDKNFTPLTLDEMRILEPKVFERADL